MLNITINNVKTIVTSPVTTLTGINAEINRYCAREGLTAEAFMAGLQVPVILFEPGTRNTTCQVCGVTSTTELCERCSEFRTSRCTTAPPTNVLDSSYLPVTWLDASMIPVRCHYCGEVHRGAATNRRIYRVCGVCENTLRLARVGYPPAINRLTRHQHTWLPDFLLKATMVGGDAAYEAYTTGSAERHCVTCGTTISKGRVCDTCKKKAQAVRSAVQRGKVGTVNWKSLVEYYSECLQRNPKAWVSEHIKEEALAMIDPWLEKLIALVLQCAYADDPERAVQHICSVIGLMVKGDIPMFVDLHALQNRLRAEASNGMDIPVEITTLLDKAIAYLNK